MIVQKQDGVKSHVLTFPDAPAQRETIYRQGEPGAGGMHTTYRISVADGKEYAHHTIIHFQGQKVGNDNFGVTNESLLAVVLDRLECAQEGQYPCQESERAIDALEYALEQLKARSKRRYLSGLAGKNEEVPFVSDRPSLKPIATNDDGTAKNPATPVAPEGGEEKTEAVSDEKKVDEGEPKDKEPEGKQEIEPTTPEPTKPVEPAKPAPANAGAVKPIQHPHQGKGKHHNKPAPAAPAPGSEPTLDNDKK